MYRSLSRSLSIIRILSMLAEEMLVADAVRCRLYLRIDQLGLGRHLRNLLQHDCIVNCLCRILAPGKRTVVLAEDARRVHRL